jgi:hypothetical protein
MEDAMLWDASLIKGYVIAAHDGQLGGVSDFLFEDVHWMIRWLVVDTGHWLAGRKVLLPPSALGHPNVQARRFPVNLTMQQVKDSPEIDTQRPVSRQMEEHIYDFYGWERYWMGAMAAPFVAPPCRPGSNTLKLVSAEKPSNADDPHLRSAAALLGYHIHATDADMGHVADFIVDDVSWRIRHLVIDTRNWWPGQQVLISPRTIRKIDWVDRSIHLNISRQQIEHSPAYDPAKMADRADEGLVLKYYRRRG